jgi:hypothetical protein
MAAALPQVAQQHAKGIGVLHLEGKPITWVKVVADLKAVGSTCVDWPHMLRHAAAADFSTSAPRA